MAINLFRSMFTSQLFKTDIINLLMITVIWSFMVILVNPIGDFPLNDDWAYGYSVKVLLEKGDFKLSGWTATNLFSQVLWGALFCLPFGFSFTALRFSTLTLGLIGILSTYGLLRELNQNHKVSLIGALLMAINPIYFGLSNTFMSDIPFLGFATLSLYFLLRGLKYNSSLEVTIGILVTCLAILQRQVGLAIPLAFGCAYLIKKGATLQTFIKGFFPTILGIFIQVFYQKWLQYTGRLPDNYGNQIKTLIEELHKGVANGLSNFTKITLFSLIYLGLFLFPFLLIAYSRKIKELPSRRQSLSFLALSLFFVVVMNILKARNKLMPLAGNVMGDFGIDPVTLKNSELLKAPHWLWIILTAIGVVGAALLLHYLFFMIVDILFYKHNESLFIEQKWLKILIVSAICIYFLPIGFLGLGMFGFYDRYLLFLLPLLMLTVAASTANLGNWKGNSKSMSIALVMMLVYGGFTVAATHDYLSWNRVRWQALRALMQEQQLSPHSIDGGFEFNGWYLYDPKYKNMPEKSWYWVDKDDYVVSFNPLKGYEEVKRYPFRKWLTWDQGNIFVLHNTNTLLLKGLPQK